MKKLLILSLLLTGVVAACGDINAPALPIAGNYQLTTTACPGRFPQNLQVNQDNYTISGDSIPPSTFPFTGTINATGNMVISSGTDPNRIICDGTAANNVLSLNCDIPNSPSCAIQYTKQ